MDYFSGLSGQSLSFALMMSICGVAILFMLIGFYCVFKKWSRGSVKYGVEPEENQSILTFFKVFINQYKSSSVHHGQPLWKTLIFDVLLQRRVYKADKLRWIMHLMIFYGWMGLFSLSGLMFAFEAVYLTGLVDFNIEEVRGFLQFPNQILGYILLIGVLIAIFRRLFIKKVRDSTNSYDSILLMTLFVVVATGFIAHAGRYIDLSLITTQWENTLLISTNLYKFDVVLWTLGGLDFFKTYVQEFALMHSVIAIFIGFAYIPFSKYLHAVATPLSLIVNKGGEN
ncbi:MAG: disulfide reductase [Methanosarcinaceae archaeon]|nr:disulfide reductase [Methanosarcinaceae archaeon]